MSRPQLAQQNIYAAKLPVKSLLGRHRVLAPSAAVKGEESEQWLGEWMEERGNRDEMVVATKYCGPWQQHEGTSHKLQSNFGGGNSKNLHLSVEASLKKLRTSYIDLLYVHYWDMTTSVEEMMQSLNHLISARRVLYLGISDTPA
ncbi:MAG: hypothetical protein Q9177_005235, partial [Variospora cf. flavescens]